MWQMLICILPLFLGLSAFQAVAAQSCNWPPSPITPPNADSLYGIVTIPVVVHIVWRTAEENISDAQVISQIEALNRDYRLDNDDFVAVSQPLFRQMAADMELRFVLAETDPQGQPTNGILRRATTLEAIATAYAFDGRRRVCYNELGGSDAWPSRCYLNIWVADFPSGLAGQATLPGQAPVAEDGVFVAPDRFGQTGTALPPYHLGRTATHEVGHYFNLLHLWGPAANPACGEDDGVGDTPCQSLSYLNQCPLGAGFTCGTPDMTQNFMGLSQDACLLFFTHGQKRRVREAIANWRSGYLDASACITGVAPAPTPLPPALRVNARLDPAGLWMEVDTPNAWAACLFDVYGRRIDCQAGSGPASGRRPVAGLTPGIYFLSVADGVSRTAKKLMFAP